MKKIILTLFALIVLVGTANASVYDDPQSVWGTWVGSLTVNGASESASLVLGGDASSHDPGSGYFYIPGTMPFPAAWSDTLMDKDGDMYTYTASIPNIGAPNNLSYEEVALTGTWGVSLQISFMPNLSTMYIMGTGYDDVEIDEFGNPFPVDTYALTGEFVRATPIPGAVWLLGTGVLGLFGLRNKFQS